MSCSTLMDVDRDEDRETLTIKTPGERCGFKSSMIELMPGARTEEGEGRGKHWRISDDSQSCCVQKTSV